ncbi:RDD family protein [Acaricomes phytoseiuli]|uniref:RDD family protein n=1 Tax=Acaricomes phytoseiuli TaxID=291968 RepID=UPI0022235959|nr:RDD family protein [Acaricomes phytoseiuli]MCW1249867.1 RDD family protein [Acaricomes phytoseiuli]
MSSIVTGEAVVLELRPASFASRALGAILDAFVLLVILIVGYIAFFSIVTDLDPSAIVALSLGWLLFCLLIIPLCVETLSRGRSIGKLAAGLRIVRSDGGAIRFRHALLRSFTAILEIYMTLGGIALITALVNERSQRLGDLLAGTYAIRERSSEPPRTVITAPPFLAPWLALADIGRIPDGLGRRIAQFLHQAPEMSAPSRDRLGKSLAEETLLWVATPPPPGTHPEAYLAAVVAARRERDYQRLSTAQERASDTSARLTRLPFE